MKNYKRYCIILVLLLWFNWNLLKSEVISAPVHEDIICWCGFIRNRLSSMSMVNSWPWRFLCVTSILSKFSIAVHAKQICLFRDSTVPHETTEHSATLNVSVTQLSYGDRCVGTSVHFALIDHKRLSLLGRKIASVYWKLINCVSIWSEWARAFDDFAWEEFPWAKSAVLVITNITVRTRSYIEMWIMNSFNCHWKSNFHL